MLLYSNPHKLGKIAKSALVSPSIALIPTTCLLIYSIFTERTKKARTRSSTGSDPRAISRHPNHPPPTCSLTSNDPVYSTTIWRVTTPSGKATSCARINSPSRVSCPVDIHPHERYATVSCANDRTASEAQCPHAWQRSETRARGWCNTATNTNLPFPQRACWSSRCSCGDR